MEPIKIIEDFETTPYRKDMTLDSFKARSNKQKDILDRIKKNLKDWYVFFGNVGTGKTHLATAIVRSAWEKGERSQEIVKFRNICAQVRADFSQETKVVNYYSSFDILVLEEIGRGYNSGFESSILFEILDNRYENKKQTILTTNMSMGELVNFIEKATLDRLKERATFIHFDWESHREVKGNEKNS